LVIQALTGLSIVDILPIACFAFTTLFYVVTGKGALYMKRLTAYVRNMVPGISTPITLLLTAGFFVEALRVSGVTAWLTKMSIGSMTGEPQLQLLVISFVMILIGLVGVSPLIAILLVASALDPGTVAVSPALLTLALTIGSGISIIVCPF